MSFYGSTYYQLIDAFSKIVLRNTGGAAQPKNPVNGPITIEAKGRSNSLSLTGANKWIVLENPEGGNEIKIYHGEAENPTTGLLGFRANNYDPNLQGSDVVQLESGEPIQTSIFQCDATGHIIEGTVKQLKYKLPTTQIEEDISNLEDSVNKVQDDLEEKTNDIIDIQNQLKEIDVNGIKNDIITINSVYDSENAKVTFGLPDSKTFPSYFGKLDKIKSEIEDTLNNEQFKSFMISAKNRVDGQNYSEIEGHYNTKDLSTALQLLSALIAVIGENTIITNATANNSTILIDGLNAKITNHITESTSQFSSLESRLSAIEAQLGIENQSIIKE